MKLSMKVLSRCTKKLAIISIGVRATAEGSPVRGPCGVKWMGSGDWLGVLTDRG